MNYMKIKLLVGGLIVIAAVTILAIAGVSGGLVSYRQVDEVLRDPALQHKRIRIAGTVAEQNVEARPVQLMARFELVGTRANLPVVYKGSIPDNFKPGGAVVVEGRMDDKGVFQADVMLTKCASKYEADHAKRLEKSS